jgi:brefeldin A-resistance guanine nucleotide exchange factor 1
MLESFRLPGEAQQIDRITETFAQVYCAANPDGDVKNADAAYVLAFSIIMLNTDLHSPQIRKRMTLEDYGKNLKGVNDKADFAPEYIVRFDGLSQKRMVDVSDFCRKQSMTVFVSAKS